MGALRTIFMGTPDFAAVALQALLDAGHDVIAVYSQPPRPKGRGMDTRKSPVHLLTEKRGIAVRTPVTLRNPDEIASFQALNADVAVVAAYGLILPKAVLAAPRYGCLNIHASLLPRWRGAAPVQRAIMAGDEATGVTIMQMEAGLDTGPMLLKRALEIEDKNAAQLTEELAKLGAVMMVEVLADLPEFEPIEQPDDGVTYAAKISKEEARIDWSRPAAELVRQIQGLAPFPGAWFEANGERIKLLAAEITTSHGAPGEVIDDRLTIGCGNGALRPTQVQRAGKGVMSAEELLRGFFIAKGKVLR